MRAAFFGACFGEFKLTRRGNWLAVRGRTLRSAEIGLWRAKKCPAVRGIKLAPLEIKLAVSGKSLVMHGDGLCDAWEIDLQSAKIGGN